MEDSAEGGGWYSRSSSSQQSFCFLLGLLSHPSSTIVFLQRVLPLSFSFLDSILSLSLSISHFLFLPLFSLSLSLCLFFLGLKQTCIPLALISLSQSAPSVWPVSRALSQAPTLCSLNFLGFLSQGPVARMRGEVSSSVYRKGSR